MRRAAGSERIALGEMLRRTLLLVLVPLGLGLPSGASASAGARAAVPASADFRYTGKEQTFVVPRGVSSVEVVALGAAGGTARGVPGSGAARVYGTRIGVHPGETLYIEVGGKGQDSDALSCPGVADCKEAPGGFNGGGTSVAEGGGESGGGGGGASDIQTSSISAGREASFSRLVVAAGGGGSGGNGTLADAFGGHGGAPDADGGDGSSVHFASVALGGGGGVGASSSNGGRGGVPGGLDFRNVSVYFPGNIGEEGSVGAGGTGAGVAIFRPCQGCPVKAASGSGGGGGGGYFGGGGGGSGGIYECASKSLRCDPAISPDLGGGGGGGGGSSFAPNGRILIESPQQSRVLDGNGDVMLSWSR